MLKQIKTKILSLISSRGIKRSLFFGGVVFIIMHFGFDTVFAVEPTGPAGTVGDTANLINSISGAIQFLIGIAASLLGALTGAISILLDPGITNGTVFNISVYIKEVWVFVSNLVYLIFAGILIVISFANIVGKGEGDMFLLKKALPKFVVGVLIVPFSWWVVQFMVSLSSILMVSVYTWPIETFTANAKMEPLMEKKIEWCKDWIINIQGNITTTNATTTENNKGKGGFIECATDPIPKQTIREILTMKDGDSYNIGGLLSIYTFGVMDIKHTTKVLTPQLKLLSTVGSLTAKVIFDVIFILMYTLILVALFLILFVRVIMLWIFMMISPIFGLAYFLGGKGGKIGESLNKFNFTKFLELAMVPVYVAAALSFGLMFTFIIGAGFNDSNSNPFIQKTGKDPTIKLGYINLTIKGAVGSSNGKPEDGDLSIALGGLLGNIGIIMIKLFSLAFLWVAVMSALKSASITKSIVEPIEKFGNDVGKFAMESPKYIPIPGTSGMPGGKQSINSVLGTGNMAMDHFKRSDSDKSRKLFERFVPPSEEIKKLDSEIKDLRGKGRTELIAGINKLIENTGEENLLKRNTELADLMNTAGIKGSEKIKQVSSSDDLITKFVEIGKDKENQNKGIGWRDLNETQMKSYVGGNKSSDETKKEGDKVDSSKTNIYVNLSQSIAGITQKDGNASIDDGKEKEVKTALIAGNGWKADGKVDTDKLANELISKIGSTDDDKNKIVEIIKQLGEEGYLKDIKKEDPGIEVKANAIVEGIINPKPYTPPAPPPVGGTPPSITQ